jgi:glycosyltransferase involved in cell wall biosynthesis
MKICFSSYSDLNEPTVLNFFYLGEELAKIGHDVTLLLPKIGEKLYVEESGLIHIKRLKIFVKPGPVRIASQTIIQTFHSIFQNFDVIHSIKPLVQSTVPVLAYSRLKEVLKLVHMDDYESYGALLTGYNTIFSKFIEWYEIEVLKYFDAITCVSPFLSNLAKISTFKKNIFTIPNGFHPKNFKNVKPIRNSNSDECSLLYVGALRKNTDIDFIIKAMPLIIKKIQNVKLIIVGDGPIKNQLIALAKKLGVRDQIIFKGIQPNTLIPRFLVSADALLLPLRKNPFNEARFSNKIPEYMASGKPIITNSVGVIKEIIKDHVNGIVVEPDNLELYAQAVINSIENNQLARKIGKNARNYAMKNLTWERIAKKFDRIYTNLYNTKKI